MNRFKFLLILFIFGSIQFSLAQTKIQLDLIEWNYEAPKDFEINPANYGSEFISDGNSILEVFKPEETHINHLKVDYKESHNLKSLTLEIYAFSLVEVYKKGYNTDDFSGDVQMERKKINNQVYYLIRSQILHKESNYNYVSDVYLAEINGKEFIVTINYDNDEDKMKLEESFFNSYFS